MPKCQALTLRRTWCVNDARPGFTTCAAHADGPWFTPTPEDYATADAAVQASPPPRDP